MSDEEFQISVPPKFCIQSTREPLPVTGRSNVPPGSSLTFLCQDQRENAHHASRVLETSPGLPFQALSLSC